MPHDKKKPKIALVISIGGKPKKDDKKKYGDAMPHNAMNKAWDVLKISMTDNPESAFASSSGTEGFNYGQNPVRCEFCGEAAHQWGDCPVVGAAEAARGARFKYWRTRYPPLDGIKGAVDRTKFEDKVWPSPYSRDGLAHYQRRAGEE